MNPADLQSRGSTPTIWRNGPKFLHQVRIEEFIDSHANYADEIKMTSR